MFCLIVLKSLPNGWRKPAMVGSARILYNGEIMQDAPVRTDWSSLTIENIEMDIVTFKLIVGVSNTEVFDVTPINVKINVPWEASLDAEDAIKSLMFVFSNSPIAPENYLKEYRRETEFVYTHIKSEMESIKHSFDFL